MVTSKLEKLQVSSPFYVRQSQLLPDLIRSDWNFYIYPDYGKRHFGPKIRDSYPNLSPTVQISDFFYLDF